MQFSSRTTIATHILLCMVAFEGKYKLTSTFLAASVNVNPVIIRNVLGQLKAADLVRVEAGVGGASVAKPLAEISLLDIFDAVEAPEENLFHFHESPNPACPVGRNVHRVLDKKLEAAQQAMRDSLRSVTLDEIARELTAAISAESD